MYNSVLILNSRIKSISNQCTFEVLFVFEIYTSSVLSLNDLSKSEKKKYLICLKSQLGMSKKSVPVGICR